MKNRILSAILISALIVTSLSGCGEDTESTPNQQSSLSQVNSSESKPAESSSNKPKIGTMGTATVAGTEIDIAATESLFIINKKLYDSIAPSWKYEDFADYESHFNSVIYISENLSKDDLNELSRLSNIKELEIDYAGISDISFLENYTNLKQLTLRNNEISDITPLTGLTNLTELYLDNNQISDIKPLAGLTNLGSLVLYGNQISDEDIAWLKEKLPNW